jgi:uncharacterized membrane protein YkoI
MIEVKPWIALTTVAAALWAFGDCAAVAQAQSRGDQSVARKEITEGRQLSSREIENIVLPQFRGWTYVNFNYDGVAKVYRLRFSRGERLMDVDVDARTGRVISRSP